MKKMFAAALVAGAVAVPMGGAPAFADHTLCDNEPSDVRFSPNSALFAGADLNSPGALYLCVNNAMVVVRTDRVGVTICTVYTNNGDPSDDACPIRT